MEEERWNTKKWVCPGRGDKENAGGLYSRGKGEKTVESIDTLVQWSLSMKAS